jgi:hypothetical protein
VNQLLQDARFGVRTLVRARGFAAVAMLTLAISIGGNAAIFSFVDGVLLKPLPYPNPDAIVRIWERTPTGFNNWVSAETFLDWKRQVTRFESISPGRSDRSRLPGEKNRSGCAGRACRPPSSMYMASRRPGAGRFRRTRINRGQNASSC